MRFWKNDDGAVLIYVTLIIAAFIGIGGLALDAGRAFTLREEMQQAADAAALAGAWQLDGTAAGAARADAAARAVVANSQKWAQSAGGVTIAGGTAGVQFLSTVPASDDAALTFTTAAPFDHIWVKTTATNFDSWFMRLFGGGTTQMAAEAVATKGSSICQVTPLFMCLPGGASFDPAQHIGKQVQMKAGGNGSWTNGNWGLLDTPGGSQSTPALAAMIAGSNGLPQCINNNGVDTKPGAVASVTPAFNVRFDMFENPQASQYRTLPGFAPAENVTKGKTPNNAQCNAFSDTTARMTRLGRDSFIDPVTRLGDGQWDCAGYWALAHPNDAANIPAGCTSTGGITRFEVYRHEIFGLPNKALVPNTTATAVPAVAAPHGDDGNPQCYAGGPIPPTPTATSQLVNDRRIFTVAGVDCANLVINGNTPNVPVQHFLSMFITEPADTQGGQTQGDVYMEIVGHSAGGGGGIVPIQLREWVELVR